MHQTAPGSLAHKQTNLSPLEHVGHQIATGTCHLINDHYLWPPDPGGRTRERITIAGNVVEITIKVALENIDNVVGRRTTAVETLIDHHTLLVSLREVVTIKTRVAGLTGVGQINVSKLTIRKFLDQPPVRLDPRARSQSLFVRHRDNRDAARALHSRRGVYSKGRLPVGSPVEKPVD